jgi:hypothetical protein
MLFEWLWLWMEITKINGNAKIKLIMLFSHVKSPYYFHQQSRMAACSSKAKGTPV